MDQAHFEESGFSDDQQCTVVESLSAVGEQGKLYLVFSKEAIGGVEVNKPI